MMDFFAKNRMLFWLIVVLVLLNVVTLTSFWLRRPLAGPAGGLQGRPGGQQIMEAQLHLTDEQALQFERLRREHFQRTRPLQDQAHKLRMDLLDEIFAPEPNEARIEALTAEIGDRQTEFERQLFQHFRQLKDVCNADQVAQLKRMLADLLKATRPGDPRRPPNRPGNGPRPEGPPPMR